MALGEVAAQRKVVVAEAVRSTPVTESRPVPKPAPPRRAFRLALSASLLALAAAAFVRHFVLTHSTLAVVTGRVVTIRAPIDGVVSGLPAVGQRVAAGAEVAGLLDERVDNLELLRVEADLDETRGRVATLEALIGELNAFNSTLRKGAETYQAARVKQLELMEERARARIAAEQERGRELDLRLARSQALEQEGLLSKEQADALRSSRKVSEEDLRALSEDLAAVHFSANAARSGVLMDPAGSLTGSERPYSMQRADEIRLRLEVHNQELARSKEQLVTLERHAKELRDRLALLRSAKLSAPVLGRVTQTSAANGEFVVKGQDLLKLVQCDSGLIMAVLNERNFNRVAVGSRASVRASTFGPRYDAEVVETTGPLQVHSGNVPAEIDGSHNLLRNRYSVLLRSRGFADATKQSCTLGGTVDVAFDAWGMPWD